MTRGIQIALSVACAALAATAHAQTWPAKPIMIVSEGNIGSIGDVAIRMLAVKMGEGLGQAVQVESRPGAQGALAAGVVKKAAPDGYTLFHGASSGLVIARFMVKNFAYDSLRDFEPVSAVISTATMLVTRSSLPVNSVKDLIAYAKANPGELTYGSTGLGSPFHLWGEALKSAAGINMLHVPYNSGNANTFVTDIISGRLDVLWLSYTLLRTQLKSGKLRVLASNTEERYKHQPDIPTVTEAVPGYRFLPSIYALLAPRGTPRSITERLARELRAAEENPQIAEKMDGLGMIPLAGTPEQLTQRITASIQSLAVLAKEIGLEPN